jgi:hypothetical protein
LALVAAIAAPLSSVHALEAIDDAALSDMTGQAGVTIDLTTQVSIDSVTWTDTKLDTAPANEIGGGSVVISDIKIGGHDAENDALEHVRINIDAGEGVKRVLDAADNSVTEGGDALRIEITTEDGLPVELGLDVGSVALAGWDEGSALLSDVKLDVTLATQLIVVHEAGTQGNGVANIDMSGYFRVDDASLNVDVIGAGITGLKVGQIDFNDDGTFKGWANGNYLAGNTAGKDLAADQTAATYAAAGMAYYQLNVSTGESTGTLNRQTGQYENKSENALIVNVANFDADIAIQDITLGGGSIGSVGISNLAITDTSLTIYGH